MYWILLCLMYLCTFNFSFYGDMIKMDAMTFYLEECFQWMKIFCHEKVKIGAWALGYESQFEEHCPIGEIAVCIGFLWVLTVN